MPISTAPFDRDFELAVINYTGTHALAFPCRRILGSWINAETKKRLDVRPTHWREWQGSPLKRLRLLRFRWIIQCCQFGLFLHQQTQDRKSLSFVLFGSQLLAKMFDVKTSDCLVHRYALQ